MYLQSVIQAIIAENVPAKMIVTLRYTVLHVVLAKRE